MSRRYSLFITDETGCTWQPEVCPPATFGDMYQMGRTAAELCEGKPWTWEVWSYSKRGETQIDTAYAIANYVTVTRQERGRHYFSKHPAPAWWGDLCRKLSPWELDDYEDPDERRAVLAEIEDAARSVEGW